MRSALLTFGMHRFEVLFAVGLLALTGISALVVTSHIEGAGMSQACWDQYDGGDQLSRQCRRAFSAVTGAGDTYRFVHESIAVYVPWIVGLLLGVPLVGRELETGTASLAWSLTGRRGRWLMKRLLPVLVLVLVGSAIVGFLLGRMVEVASLALTAWAELEIAPSDVGGRLPDLSDLGREGIPFVLRTVAALGVGLLMGAIIGRTMAAFATGAVLCLVLYFALGPGIQTLITEQTAVWIADDRGHSIQLQRLGRGYATEGGGILSEAEIEALWVEQCTDCGKLKASGDWSQAQYLRFEEWRTTNFTKLMHIVPLDAFTAFERAEALAGLAVASGTMLLTFPLVSRRRPN